MDGSILYQKSSIGMLGLPYSSKLNRDYIAFTTKITSKSWFFVWTFFFRGCTFALNLRSGLAWNTLVMSSLVLLIANWTSSLVLLIANWTSSLVLLIANWTSSLVLRIANWASSLVLRIANWARQRNIGLLVLPLLFFLNLRLMSSWNLIKLLPVQILF